MTREREIVERIRLDEVNRYLALREIEFDGHYLGTIEPGPESGRVSTFPV